MSMAEALQGQQSHFPEQNELSLRTIPEGAAAAVLRWWFSEPLTDPAVLRAIGHG